MPRLPKIESGIGSEFELLVVTCVVVGGVAISGGQGRLIGVLLAVVLMTMIRPVLTFMDIGEAGEKWTRAIQGMFILLAVVTDSLSSRRRRSSIREDSRMNSTHESRSGRSFPWWHETVIGVLLIVVLLVAGWLVPGFLKLQSQLLLSRQLWEFAILALGMTLIIITGGIDLSVGSTMGLSAVVFGGVHTATGSLLAASLACLITGLCCGAVNGALVSATATASIDCDAGHIRCVSRYRGRLESGIFVFTIW